MKKKSWTTKEAADQPAECNGKLSVAASAQGFGADRKNDCKKPVESHEHQGVDGDKSSKNDEKLDEFTPEVAKWPRRCESIVSGCEGDTKNDEKKIRNL